jgi:hypothetical protein
MLKSNINSSVMYNNTKRDIDPADVGHESYVYPFRLYDEEVEIALGKPKYEFSSKYGIVYYPLYLVIEDGPVSRIGVYELENSQVLKSFKGKYDVEDDDDNDEDTNQPSGMELMSSHLLLNISKEYFDNILKVHPLPLVRKDEMMDAALQGVEAAAVAAAEEETNEPAEPETAEDEEHLTLPSHLKKHTEDIFEKVPPVFREPLPEETKEVSDKIKKEFDKSLHVKWVQKFTKNKYYNVIDNEGGGDCLFAVIRDAFQFAGKRTTVEKLRNILADELTPDVYTQTRFLYMNFLSELQDKDKEIKELNKASAVLKKRGENASTTDSQKQAILKEASVIIEKHNKLVNEKKQTSLLLEEFKYMAEIDSFEKYREFIKTSQYWADTWAISTLERVLNVKIVILSEGTFRAGDVNSVLQCGQLNDTELQDKGYFKPDYYILTSYTGSEYAAKNHYTLVTYKERGIFTFRELPYDIKVMVINKCMERNSGAYYLIEDFVKLKRDLGLDPNEGENKEEDEETDREMIERGLFEKDVAFMFYEKSNGKPKAGTGSGEKIDKVRIPEFNMLNQITDWRRQLDDSWMVPFTLDGKRWGSVEHYFLGSQYKKGFPDFYAQFSLDSKSDLSKDLAMAKAAVSTGKYKTVVLRDKKIKPDADFFEIKVNPRHVEERRLALDAKFSQNLDLKRTLLETKKAKLMHYVKSGKPETDVLLMELREGITL